eukprot:gene14323-49_t
MAEPYEIVLDNHVPRRYCANFTVTVLKELFDARIMDYVELDVIAWGNAHKGADGEPQCQHGPLECELNKLINCAVALEPEQRDFFPFLQCMEGLVLHDVSAAKVVEVAHQCAVKAGMVPAKLLTCFNGQLGSALQRLAGEHTSSLKPAHQYVPWVVVNGIPLLEDLDNLLKYICVAYTGRDRPRICLDIPPMASAAASAGAVAPGGKHAADRATAVAAAQEQYKPCKPGQLQQKPVSSSSVKQEKAMLQMKNKGLPVMQ